jgi:membrane protein insertase Oxa1/YidC/SpoIIIJ
MQHVPNKKNNNKFVSFFFFLFFPIALLFYFSSSSSFLIIYLFVCFVFHSVYTPSSSKDMVDICVCVCARARERERPPRASKNMSPAVYNGKKKKENPKEAIGNIR